MGPRPYRVALALCLAVALLGVATAAGHTTASSTEPTDTATGHTLADAPRALETGSVNLTADWTAFIAAAPTEDGGVIVGGSTGQLQGDATLTKVAPDGAVAWTRTYAAGNASGVVDVETGPDGGVYVLQHIRDSGGSPPTEVRLGRVTDSGVMEWLRPVDAEVGLGGSGALAVSERGPAIAGQAPGTRAPTLTQFDADGNVAWNRTYDVEAIPRAVRTTDDGYLVVGAGSFDRPWVLRTDADGEERLNETYTGMEIRRPVGAVPTDEGFVIAGTHSARGVSAPLVAKIGDDGVPRWSRVYPAASDVQLRDVFADGDGVALFGSGGFSGVSPPAGHLIGVGPDGGERYAERVEGFLPLDAVAGSDRAVLVGVRGLPGENVTGELRTVALPDASADGAFQADVALTSNETHYRGQNIAIEDPDLAGETVDVRRVPGDGDDFEAGAVRRLTADASGRVVFESATLPRGEYVLAADGDPLVFEDGSVASDGDADAAQFRLVDHDLRGPLPERVGDDDRDRDSFLDRAAGETEATITVRSSPERAEYTLHVGVDRFRGGPADAETLRALFGDDDGFEGVERVRGETVARVAADGGEEAIDVAAGDVAPGLYRVTLRSADTAEAGARRETRLVVGPAEPRPLSLSLENGSLSVPVGGEASTNVTVSGATDGIGALSMSASRSGPPAVGLSADVSIDARSGRGSGSWSDREATASARAMGGDTPNGTVTVGSLSVDADARAISPNASASNTVTFGLDWVVDEGGAPYTVPDRTTIPVEVTDIENATGGRQGGHGSSSASGSASGGAGSGAG